MESGSVSSAFFANTFSAFAALNGPRYADSRARITYEGRCVFVAAIELLDCNDCKRTLTRARCARIAGRIAGAHTEAAALTRRIAAARRHTEAATGYTFAVARNSGLRRAFAACSNAYAYLINRASLHAPAKNDRPTGSPNACPAGTVMCGYPATADAVE